jgi:hypothetical protein
MTFYIHIADPAYPDAPWPGERRLGPFLTADEALNQAISDASQGFGWPLGIYDEKESEKHSDGTESHQIHSQGEIRKAAESLQKQNAKERSRAVEEQRQMIEQTLPDGITWDDLQGMGT